MTAPSVDGRYAVRVMVTPVWDNLPIQVDESTTIAQLKRDALRAALKRSDVNEQEYVVKFRGAAVLDESLTLRALGAGHPERPQRFEAVLEALRRPELASFIEWVEAAPATREAIERVHPAAYIDLLEAMDARGGGGLDADTFLGPRSWESVLASAGVALAAVAQGMRSGDGTAFAIT